MNMVYGLLLKGFSEKYLLTMLEQVQCDGAMTQLVGVTARAVRGQGGWRVLPDVVIGDMRLEGNRPILLIPDNDDTVALLTEARIHRLIRRFVAEGVVIVAPAVAAVLARIGLQGVRVVAGGSAEISASLLNEV